MENEKKNSVEKNVLNFIDKICKITKMLIVLLVY